MDTPMIKTNRHGKVILDLDQLKLHRTQNIIHLGHKDWGIGEVTAVGQLKKCCCAQPCFVGAINRSFHLTCSFLNMVRCLLTFAQAIVLRWCNSTRPRCFKFPRMCLPRNMCEDPSWRTCTKSCDASTYIGWSNGFVVNTLSLAAFNCILTWCSPHDKASIISTRTGKERAHNIKSSAYLIFVSAKLQHCNIGGKFPYRLCGFKIPRLWGPSICLLNATQGDRDNFYLLKLYGQDSTT